MIILPSWRNQWIYWQHRLSHWFLFDENICLWWVNKDFFSVCTAWVVIIISILHLNEVFSLRISSVNVTKSAGNCRFGHIYWKKYLMESFIFVQCWISGDPLNSKEFLLLVDSTLHIVNLANFQYHHSRSTNRIFFW